MKNMINLAEFSKTELTEIINKAKALKDDASSGKVEQVLKGKNIGLVFENPYPDKQKVIKSAVEALGGTLIDLSSKVDASCANNLKGKADVFIVSSLSHSDVEAFEDACEVPVINFASDYTEPVCVFGDLLTIIENNPSLRGQTICYVGPISAYAHSLMFACSKLGMRAHLACPDKYAPKGEILKHLNSSGYFKCSEEFLNLGFEADIVYSAPWYFDNMSEDEKGKRQADFEKFAINRVLDMIIKPNAIYLSAPLVHIGEEIDGDLYAKHESDRQTQAENLLYGIEAVLINTIL